MIFSVSGRPATVRSDSVSTGMLLYEHIIPEVWPCLFHLASRYALSIVLLAFPCLAAATALAESHLPGHLRSLDVPRIESSAEAGVAAPVIDGKLDDTAWELANVSTDFWCSLLDKPPTDKTEVLVIRDDSNLYFGFRMYDSVPEAIQSARTVRDVGLGYDDSIKIELDTYLNHRDISTFSLNPAGTQSDDIAGGRSSKIEWKGDWQGAATRTAYGWSAEFAIPLAILNYKNGDTRFGVNFKRYQNRTKEDCYWADVTPQALVEEMGQLTGLSLPETNEKKAWTFMPFMLAGRNIPDKKGDVRDTLVTAGMDMRYQPRPNLTAMFAVNPDFSQVEEAVTNISFSYTEKALDDNRPFFVEGSSYFSSADDNNEYFYSNRVADFDVGARSFGRIGQVQFGSFVSKAPEHRTDLAARALYEVDQTNSAVTSVVATSQPGFDNLLAVAQFAGRQTDGLNYTLDAALTDTSNVTDTDVPLGSGSHLKGSLGWKGDYFYIEGTGDNYDRDYFPAIALLDDDLPGTKGASLTTGYYQQISDSVWRVAQGYVGVKYRETDAGEKQRQKVFGSGSMEFSSDIRIGLYIEEGPYRPVSVIRGVFEPYINHDRYFSISADFNTRSSRYSGGLQHDWGNLGGAPYEYYSAYGWWRPVKSLYLSVTAERTDSFGTADQMVLVSSWDISPEHALAGRYIYTGDIEYYRLAYAHRPRKGLDIFAVYDDNTVKDAEFSIKVVKTF